VFNGTTYDASNPTGVETLIAVSGCDSIVNVTVTELPLITGTLDSTICSGDSFVINGTTYDASNTSGLETFIAVNGCDSIVTVTVIITPNLSATPNAVDPICLSKESLILTANSTGFGTITWYDTDGVTIIGTGSPFDATAYIATTGVYTFYVNEENGSNCDGVLTPITVIVGGVTASIGALPNTGFVPLDVEFTNGSSTGLGITYTWDFGDGTSDNVFEPSHTYTDINNYIATLTVTDAVGCEATATIRIEVIGESTVIIPNVFTPNGDGSNDVFMVSGTNLESIEGQILNRWGQTMFEWNHLKGHWDGRTLSGGEAPDGTYFYIITVKGIDGKEYFKKGGFSLIR
jgi:gliding motility-associated-like protein